MQRQSVVVMIIMALGPSLLGSLFSSAPRAWAQVEYISPAQSHQLSHQFTSGQSLTEADLELLSQSALNCSMFGVRSRMSVERDVTLYQLRPHKGHWLNRGSQPISNYRWSPDRGLRGEQSQGEETVTDELRRLENGHWISRLSWTREGQSLVLAYSLCVESKAVL